MRTLLTSMLLGAAGLCGACTSATPLASAPVRVLASEPPQAPLAEPEGKTSEPPPTPRIGAPGGSGAGSRRVAPQSADRRPASLAHSAL
jgi:hypothetical protein